MKVKAFGINIDKSKRLWLIVSISFFVALCLIILSFVMVFGNEKEGNLEVKNIYDLVNIKSYLAEYSVFVKSNKNENMYHIKEWYKFGDKPKFRFETFGSDNDFIYLGNENGICIKSDNQISEMKLEGYEIEKSNLLSFSTIIEFLSLYAGSNKEVCNCINVKEIEENDKIKLEIILDFNKCKQDGYSCSLYNKFKENYKIEVVFNKVDMIPLSYTLYNENFEKRVEICYSKFLLNDKFDEKLFSF